MLLVLVFCILVVVIVDCKDFSGCGKMMVYFFIGCIFGRYFEGDFGVFGVWNS